jgi:hypothetical protein
MTGRTVIRNVEACVIRIGRLVVILAMTTCAGIGGGRVVAMVAIFTGNLTVRTCERPVIMLEICRLPGGLAMTVGTGQGKL